MMNAFAKALLNWFDHAGRKNLPWQQQINPYRVWISEIMLQQTQVATVIPYFQRFMQRFPDVTHLANATEDEVLALWTGLGYYTRARNIHRTAKIIQQQYQGLFPDNLEQMQQLPGIGRSTAGAILAIAMNKTTPILDGNVKRVLTRFHAVDEWPGKSSVADKLWQFATDYTPKTRTADYTQAIMDLGATVCTRSKPLCEHCPLTKNCQAFQQGNPTAYPVRKAEIKILPVRQTKLLMLCDEVGAVLLKKRPATGIWANLWSFPECAMDEDVKAWYYTHFTTPLVKMETWPRFRHTFSHFHLDITPVRIQMQNRPLAVMDSSQQVWYKSDQPLNIGLATPIKRLLSQLRPPHEQNDLLQEIK